MKSNHTKLESQLRSDQDIDTLRERALMMLAQLRKAEEMQFIILNSRPMRSESNQNKRLRKHMAEIERMAHDAITEADE